MNKTKVDWSQVEHAMDHYFKIITKESHKITTEEFILLILAGFVISGKARLRFVDTDAFNASLFDLKAQWIKTLPDLMENTEFYYSNGKYFSDEIETALTNLQNSGIISFSNPEFRKFEIKLNRTDSNQFVRDFLEKNENIGIDRGAIIQIADHFAQLYNMNIGI